jgi:hypothetical protein
MVVVDQGPRGAGQGVVVVAGDRGASDDHACGDRGHCGEGEGLEQAGLSEGLALAVIPMLPTLSGTTDIS